MPAMARVHGVYEVEAEGSPDEFELSFVRGASSVPTHLETGF
jgi:hypothetical protein